MSPGRKNLLLATASVVAIAASAAWIYYREFKAPRHNVALHSRVGEVMAEQVTQLIGPKGKLVVVTIPTANEPELATQLEAFRKRLKHHGDYEIKEHELDTKDQPKYGLGTGLSGRRFVRTVKNNPKADLIVSFVGAPKLNDEELAELSRMPKFLVESRSTDNLPRLFEKKLIQVAVVSRFSFPAPGPTKPRTVEDWFNKRFQIVAADSAKAIPPPD